MASRNINLTDGAKGVVFASGWSTFTNIHPASITMQGVKYRNAEQAIQAEKAMYMGDWDAYHNVMNAITGAQLNSSRTRLESESWDQFSNKFILPLLTAKFEQNEDMKKELLDTGNARLIYASTYDLKWGNGLQYDEVRNGNPNEWKGTNMLRIALETVRDYLKLQKHHDYCIDE